MNVRLTVSLLIPILIFGLFSLCSANVLEGLVAHYTFDGHLQDIVSKTSCKKYGSGKTVYVKGKLGKAVNLDGVDDFIKCGIIPINEIKSSISISLWVNRMENDINNMGALVSQISQKERPPFALYFSPTNMNSGMYNAFAWYLSGEGTKESLAWGNSANIFNEKDKWYHVVVTYNGITDVPKLYVDGLEINLTWGGTIPELLSSENGELLIGSFDSAIKGSVNRSLWPFGGKIDEVLIYDRQLTEDEIDQLSQYGTCNPDFKHVKCLPDIDSSSICYLYYNGRGIGTGFLVARDMVLTAHHVFKIDGKSRDEVAVGSHVIFRKEVDTCLEQENPRETVMIPVRKIAEEGSSYQLDPFIGYDFSLIKLKRNAPSSIKIATLDPSPLGLPQPIYEIAHPSGIYLDSKVMACGYITNPSISLGAYFNHSINNKDGTSGAPLFNSKNQVVGIDCGSFVYPYALKISRIYHLIKPYLSSSNAILDLVKPVINPSANSEE